MVVKTSLLVAVLAAGVIYLMQNKNNEESHPLLNSSYDYIISKLLFFYSKDKPQNISYLYFPIKHLQRCLKQTKI